MNLISFSVYVFTVSFVFTSVFALDDLYTLTFPNPEKSAQLFTSQPIKMNLHRVSPATYLAIHTFFKKHNLQFTKPTLELVRYNVVGSPGSLFQFHRLQASGHQDVDLYNYENNRSFIYPDSSPPPLSPLPLSCLPAFQKLPNVFINDLLKLHRKGNEERKIRSPLRSLCKYMMCFIIVTVVAAVIWSYFYYFAPVAKV